MTRPDGNILGQVGGDTYLRLNDDLALEYFGKKAPAPTHTHTHAFPAPPSAPPQFTPERAQALARGPLSTHTGCPEYSEYSRRVP